MKKLSPTTVAIIEKVLGKLLERSSVAAYLVTGLAVFGIKDQQVAAQLAGWIGTAAGALLFLLNDATFGNLLKAKPTAPAEVIEPKPVTVPEPLPQTIPASPEAIVPAEEKPMNLTSLVSAFALIPNLFTVVDQAVQSVESSLAGVPGVSGSAKLQAAEAKVNTVLTSAGADIATVSSLSGVITPLINAAVGIFHDVGLFSHKSAPATTAVTA